MVDETGRLDKLLDLAPRATDEMAVLIAGISNEQWAWSTPCAGWSVRDLVAHVMAMNIKYTAVASGGEWSPVDPEVDLDDDPLQMYRQSAPSLLEAWRQPGALEREIDLPRGRGPAQVALRIVLGETLVHGWDLAKVTSQPLAFDDELAEATLAQYTAMLPPQRPDEMPFSDAGTVNDNAPWIDRLAAYLGRDVSAYPT